MIPSERSFEILNATNLEHLFGAPLKAWCFGHTHRSSTSVFHNTLITSNQAGYCIHKKEVDYEGDELDPDYDASYVVDLDFNPQQIEQQQRGWRGEINIEPV
eukprot:CAMPEP_0168607072 /NCGR_PEP_ID=MMETSP0420-20121227/16936_1 /TAXON_ID=498008 /ORGANISM="Pessonella sp." /LENGTH=101 /DNA_ID=CAMNT_0008646833 /DNA_START=621 /DNA_END=922 /DNA_ORIENTATION=+